MSEESPLIPLPPSGCPTGLQLDRLVLEELQPSEAEHVRSHAQRCERCRPRLELRSGGFAALPSLDQAAVLRNIEQQLDTPKEAKPWWSRLSPGPGRRALWVPLAAAAALLIAVLSNLRPTPNVEDAVRMKGKAGLRVYRAAAEGAIEVLSGEVLHPQDRLRFRVRAAHPNLMILGVESSNARSVYYPLGQKSSQRARLAEDGALAGAVKLDDYLGEEWIHLVACPEPFSLQALPPSASPEHLEPPAGCDATKFLIRKKPR